MKNFVVFFYIVLLGSPLLSQEIYSPDRHNNSYNSGWISCHQVPNPNPDRGESHWIMYDLKNIVDLHAAHIWNFNDPAHLDYGMKDIIIDISENGEVWKELASITLDAANGSANYTGQSGFDFNGVTARYVLITALNNYGGACTALSEVRIDVQEAALPVTLLDFYMDCPTNNGPAILTWEVVAEYNNDYYEIQYSNDLSNWQKVETVNGENQKEKTIYSIQVNTKAGYYRLRQIDYDGSETVFPAINNHCQSDHHQLSISPNPISGNNSITINYQTSTVHGIRYYLSDISGKILTSGQFSPQNNYQFQLDMSDFSKGTYVLNISEGPLKTQHRIIKI